VKTYLEANDIKVILTREGDAGLYDAGAENKKVQDMKRRIAIMEEARPLASVSIHQNSYPEEYVKGAQVFYHKDSANGKILAECLQESLRNRVDGSNHRQAKENASYYILKTTEIPAVIVECAFVDNATDRQIVATEGKRRAMGVAIAKGILKALGVAYQAERGYWKVQVGAYLYRENAEAMQKKIKAVGFDAFIVKE
jgi:N-acetylmuramoyl-L-alanine amidase